MGKAKSLLVGVAFIGLAIAVEVRSAEAFEEGGGACFRCMEGYDEYGNYTHIDFFWFGHNTSHGGGMHHSEVSGDCMYHSDYGA